MMNQGERLNSNSIIRNCLGAGLIAGAGALALNPYLGRIVTSITFVDLSPIKNVSFLKTFAIGALPTTIVVAVHSKAREILSRHQAAVNNHILTGLGIVILDSAAGALSLAMISWRTGLKTPVTATISAMGVIVVLLSRIASVLFQNRHSESHINYMAMTEAYKKNSSTVIATTDSEKKPEVEIVPTSSKKLEKEETVSHLAKSSLLKSETTEEEPKIVKKSRVDNEEDIDVLFKRAMEMRNQQKKTLLSFIAKMDKQNEILAKFTQIESEPIELPSIAEVKASKRKGETSGSQYIRVEKKQLQLIQEMARKVMEKAAPGEHGLVAAEFLSLSISGELQTADEADGSEEGQSPESSAVELAAPEKSTVMAPAPPRSSSPIPKPAASPPVRSSSPTHRPAPTSAFSPLPVAPSVAAAIAVAPSTEAVQAQAPIPGEPAPVKQNA